MHDRTFSEPLFIFGMARSGTSYLRRLVNSFPDVSLLYESKIMMTANDIFQKEDVLSNRLTFQRFLDRLKICDNAHSKLFTQPLEFYDCLYESFCRHRDFSEFCRELFSTNVDHGGTWGNKLLEKDELKMLLKLFPHAHFIVIIRDVRSVVYSLQGFKYDKTNNFIAALVWSDISKFIKEIQKENINTDIMTLRYEDLVCNSKQVLKQIASFIGIDPPKDFTMADTAHTESIEKWRNHLNSKKIRQIEEICFNEMKHFGYEPELAKGQRKMSFLRFVISLIQHVIGRFIQERGGIRGFFSYKSVRRHIKVFQKTFSGKKSS